MEDEIPAVTREAFAATIFEGNVTVVICGSVCYTNQAL